MTGYGFVVLRFFVLAGLVVLGALTVLAAAIGGWGWWVLVVLLVALIGVACYDLLQRRHSILRNYPVLGHLRFLLEGIRPELQQYFIERNFDGRPYDRDTRSAIYQRAKGIKEEQPYGTERDLESIGYEYLIHSTAPVPPMDHTPRVRIGGPDCTQPYDMALLNVSAMSFGSLSANAIEALNRGAAEGGFAHDTGEGAISPYHRNGGDLVWELGSGYFGARTDDGGFDEATVRGQGRRRPGQDGQPQAQPGREARHRRGPSGGEGDRRDRRDAGHPAGREVRLAGVPPGLLHPARAGALHRAVPRAGRRQAGRLQAVRRLAGRRPGDLQGDGRGGRDPRLHRRGRCRGRHGCGAAGVRGPRRHAADRGPDDRAQRPGRRRPARPGPGRRERQGEQRRSTS